MFISLFVDLARRVWRYHRSNQKS